METIKNLVSEENNENNSNQDNESIENTIEIECHNNSYQKYKYSNNPKINFNEVEESLLKESINIFENEKNIRKKKKYTGVKGRIIKKSRDNLLINNSNIMNKNLKPIKVLNTQINNISTITNNLQLDGDDITTLDENETNDYEENNSILIDDDEDEDDDDDENTNEDYQEEEESNEIISYN
jgi:hypothetical protein